MIGASCDEADAEKLQGNLTHGTQTARKSWADKDVVTLYFLQES